MSKCINKRAIGEICDTVFDCATSLAGFNFNNGQTQNLICGTQVPISLPWVACGGGRAPDSLTVDGLSGGVPGDVMFVPPSVGPVSYTHLTLPTICSV